MKIEIAAFSVEAAIAAALAGADRIELCSSYSTGGLTPGIATLRKVREKVKIPVFVLVRPREGDFVYSDTEFEVLTDELRMLKDEGADGFVTGVLSPGRMPDPTRLKVIKKTAGSLPLTFHRAFDRTADPFGALEIIMESGFERILTSGQESTAPQGFEMLKKMALSMKDSLIILPGGGINDENITAFLTDDVFPEIHFSAKKWVSAPMTRPENLVNLTLNSEITGDVHVMPDVLMIRKIKEKIGSLQI